MAEIAGWGRYPRADCAVARPATAAAALDALAAAPDAIARGNGRSYGDASLNIAATLDLRGLDRLIAFDPATGLLTCEAGLLLSDLIDIMLPRGWWPAVTPGSRLVTVGGMIASDVHGKNHHGVGSFCDHLAWLDLALGDGRVLRCSRDEHPDLFAATCGGMGLTGVVLRASIGLIPVETATMRQRTIRAPSLSHAFAAFEQGADATYSVAWIDCLASGASLGRSAVLLGEHARVDDLPTGQRATPLTRPARRGRRFPVDLPAAALNRLTVSAFNRLYYAAQRPGEALVEVDRYFYPLDAIAEWNRMYGRRGFVQYQCVLPLAESERGMARLLTAISGAGQGSFLAVLKRMGPQSFGLMSFPMEGYTLALDFAASPGNLALLDRLDAITVEHGGRLYLAKDARAGAGTVAAGYPRLQEFRAVRRCYGVDGRFSSLLSRRLAL